jgi:myo-inositol-1(or 4)-monophosphatase
MAYVAAGRLEAFWEFNLNSWDTAAGILLVREAGGRVTDFSGRPVKLSSEEVLASNGLIHDEMVGMFEDLFAGRELAALPSTEDYAAMRAERETNAKGLL